MLPAPQLQPRRQGTVLLLATICLCCRMYSLSTSYIIRFIEPSKRSNIECLAESVRDPYLWPFSVDSIWNTPLGSGAQFASPTSNISKSLHVGNGDINSAAWSTPIYLASTSDQVNSVINPHNETFYFQIPSNATQAAGTDRLMAVVDPEKQYGYEFSGANRTGTTSFTVGYLVHNSLYGTGAHGGTAAASWSGIAGLIRVAETQNNYIPHALALSVSLSQAQSPWVWPALSEDGNHSGYCVRKRQHYKPPTKYLFRATYPLAHLLPSLALYP